MFKGFSANYIPIRGGINSPRNDDDDDDDQGLLNKTCLSCDTGISIRTYGKQSIRVSTHRFLRDEKSDDDPIWLLQCVVPTVPI